MQTDLLSLPLSLHRITAFVIFALAIFMVTAHTAIAAMAAQRTALSQKTKIVIPFVVAAFLAS
jgi:succinate dehydrogenase/fumarate reductase cytochrome b subunit